MATEVKNVDYRGERISTQSSSAHFVHHLFVKMWRVLTPATLLMQDPVSLPGRPFQLLCHQVSLFLEMRVCLPGREYHTDETPRQDSKVEVWVLLLSFPCRWPSQCAPNGACFSMSLALRAPALPALFTAARIFATGDHVFASSRMIPRMVPSMTTFIGWTMRCVIVSAFRNRCGKGKTHQTSRSSFRYTLFSMRLPTSGLACKRLLDGCARRIKALPNASAWLRKVKGSSFFSAGQPPCPTSLWLFMRS